jgi:hypothetical protein
MDNSSTEWIKNNDDTYYTWDASIGKYGGFHHKYSNNELKTEEITLNNIGEISKCVSTVIYSHVNNCIGVSNTTVDLIPEIPKGSKFGWDSNNIAWVYYIDNDVYPSYYAKKMIDTSNF